MALGEIPGPMVHGRESNFWPLSTNERHPLKVAYYDFTWQAPIVASPATIYSTSCKLQYYC